MELERNIVIIATFFSCWFHSWWWSLFWWCHWKVNQIFISMYLEFFSKCSLFRCLSPSSFHQRRNNIQWSTCSKFFQIFGFSLSSFGLISSLSLFALNRSRFTIIVAKIFTIDSIYCFEIFDSWLNDDGDNNKNDNNNNNNDVVVV